MARSRYSYCCRCHRQFSGHGAFCVECVKFYRVRHERWRRRPVGMRQGLPTPRESIPGRIIHERERNAVVLGHTYDERLTDGFAMTKYPESKRKEPECREQKSESFSCENNQNVWAVLPVAAEGRGAEISVEDMQKIVDANEKLVKGVKDGTNTISE